jgi:hypothetical protein
LFLINIENFFFFFFYRHYNPLWVLAFSVILFHSALSLHWFLHHLILFLIFVLFSVLFVCICVLNYCHRVATQLQLNISYHIIICISSSISAIHLFLGLPLILVPIGFYSNILLGVLSSSIRITWPSQAKI